MTFPNLPGKQHFQIRANLERAYDELAYYSGRLWGSSAEHRVKNEYAGKVGNLKTELLNATPQTAGKLFRQARSLCLDMEKIIAL